MTPSDRQIPLARASITDADIAAVVEVLRSSVLSVGSKVAEFERAVAAYVGRREGVAVNSGTSGLHLCLIAEGIGPGDEVITTPFSFVASASCILHAGATPVFAEIDPHTLNLDPAAVEAKVTPRTRGIVAVDVFGQPSPIEEIAAIADRRGLALVQDACEAIGSERLGRRVGSVAPLAVFAFFPNKQITTGEGGVIVLDDPDRARILRSLANQGRDSDGRGDHVRLGYNYRLDEMSAALGVSQLSRLEDTLSRRSRVAARYGERLRRMPLVRIPEIAAETTRISWFVYVIRLDPTVDRDALIAALAAEGIATKPYFSPIHLQPYYRERFGHREGEFPITERVARSTLALPFYTEMTLDQVDFVCDRLGEHLGRSG